MDSNELSDRIKEYRERKGFTQMDLADKAELSLRTIQRIEGNKSMPRGDTLRRLSTALGVSPDDIIDWQETEDKNLLIMMNLSQLGFLAFPVLGIIIPMALWVLKKDQIKDADKIGKSIINFQISWLIYFGLAYIFWFAGMSIGLFSQKTFAWVLFIPILMYGLNTIMIVVNTIFYYRTGKVKYIGAIPFLK